MTGIFDLDSFNPKLILMEPLVATVPRESLEIYEQILIAESNPENSAWIEHEQKCFAVGFLARKRFNADKELQKRKFELAQRHLRWRSLRVTFCSNEYMLWQAG